MHEQHSRFYSHHLGHEIDLITFGTRGHPLVLLPTTLGRYYEAKDFKLIESVRWFVEQGLVQFFCLDSINNESWYNRNIHPGEKVRRHVQVRRLLFHEFIPQIRHRGGTGRVAMAGASFGGFSATNFTFRHPEMVSHLICMSGAYDISSFMGGFHDENVYFNNPVEFVPNMQDWAIWNIKVILGTSEWDICLKDNVQFSQILRNKGIDHWLDVRGWVEHDWPLWREMFPHYLSVM